MARNIGSWLGCRRMLVFFGIAVISMSQLSTRQTREIDDGIRRALASPPFSQMIERHEHYQPEFERWRKHVAGHAQELASLLLRFPNSTGLRFAEVKRIFEGQLDGQTQEVANRILDKWAKRWSGRWSNGVEQYHVWYDSQRMDGRLIQPVSISRTGFIEIGETNELAAERRSDLAINVVSPAGEITGWVSKYQQDRVEIPHIGYRINDTTLVWICQPTSPQELNKPQKTWFVFLETISCSRESAEYHIHGEQVPIPNTMLATTRHQCLHCGIYLAITYRT